jgi:bacteriocin-like protein
LGDDQRPEKVEKLKSCIMENKDLKVKNLSKTELQQVNGGLIIEALVGCAVGYWAVKGLISLFKKKD